ncbi:hypothetical protein GOP47_0005192 [Adiantum capillus-veneris]|uniref:Shq1 C-terminal domain-containing protein n=1 Tax=Adiantum capillus-veneris TaxID=13818 RepID=A0A9D4V5S1_ADICA|nr:hypothetical protein GOP47_0005192 [Adiantum capillus-veneris]
MTAAFNSSVCNPRVIKLLNRLADLLGQLDLQTISELGSQIAEWRHQLNAASCAWSAASNFRTTDVHVVICGLCDDVDGNESEGSEGEHEDEDHVSRRPTCILSEATLNKLAAGMDLQLGDLSAEEEKAFLRALAAGEFSHMIKPWEPWWLSPFASKIVLTKDGNRVAQPLEHSDKDESDLFDVPPPVDSPLPPLRDLTTKSPSPLLGIHLVEVLYSYCFTLRFFNGDWTCDTYVAAWTCLSVSRVLGSSACPETLSEALNDCFVTICSPYFKSAGGLKFALALLDDVLALLHVERPGVICALADLHRMLEKAVKDVKEGASDPATGRQKTKACTSSQLKAACKKVFFLSCWANEQPSEVFSTQALIVENEKGQLMETQESKTSEVVTDAGRPLVEEVMEVT